jgi:hypothetical protein
LPGFKGTTLEVLRRPSLAPSRPDIPAPGLHDKAELEHDRPRQRDEIDKQQGHDFRPNFDGFSSPLPATAEASAAIMMLLALPTVMWLASRVRQRRS